MVCLNVNKQDVSLSNHSVIHSIRYDRDKSFRDIDETWVEGLRDHPYSLPTRDYYLQIR